MNRALLRSLLLGLLMLAPLWCVAAEEPIGTVAVVNQEAKIIRPNQAAESLRGQERLFAQDTLLTLGRSRLQFVLEDGGRLVMDEKTRLVLTEYIGGPPPRAAFFLPRGRLRVTLTEQWRPESLKVATRETTFKVVTAHALIEAVGTDFLVYAFAEETRVIVFEGAVRVSSLDLRFPGHRIVPRNQSITLRKGTPPPQPEPPTQPRPGPTAQTSGFGSGATLDVQSDGQQAFNPEPSAANMPPPTVTVPPRLNVPQ